MVLLVHGTPVFSQDLNAIFLKGAGGVACNEVGGFLAQAEDAAAKGIKGHDIFAPVPARCFHKNPRRYQKAAGKPVGFSFLLPFSLLRILKAGRWGGIVSQQMATEVVPELMGYGPFLPFYQAIPVIKQDIQIFFRKKNDFPFYALEVPYYV